MGCLEDEEEEEEEEEEDDGADRFEDGGGGGLNKDDIDAGLGSDADDVGSLEEEFNVSEDADVPIGLDGLELEGVSFDNDLFSLSFEDEDEEDDDCGGDTSEVDDRVLLLLSLLVHFPLVACLKTFLTSSLLSLLLS